jgi:hypothetical protein
VWWALVTACNRDGDCYEPDAANWCIEPAASVNSSSGGECAVPTGDPSYRCGDYDVLQIGDGPTGEAHYFDRATGQHVATEIWSDADEFCGGDASYAWYGDPVECGATCTYGKKRLDLPPCDDTT